MAMSMRDRMLAVVQGREHDRVPFVQYDSLGAPNEQAWSVLGRGNMGILIWTYVYRTEHPNCRFASEPITRGGLQGARTILHTPAGRLTEDTLYQPTYGAGSIKHHYIQEPDDYHIFMAYLRDLVILDNLDEINRINQKLGEDGLCHACTGRTPYQQLWIQWVSLENLNFHLADCPDLVEECISLLAEKARDIFRLVPDAPIPYVVIPDNITAPVIGERYFRKYCLPLYQELAAIAAEKGIPPYAHLDGDLKPLWAAIGQSGLQGMDSLSPPPDNDTSAGQAHAMWPYMRLGINFPSSVHLADPEIIYQQAMQILNEAGHSRRLQIQISENVPPDVWRKSYPQIVKAINDFGPP